MAKKNARRPGGAAAIKVIEDEFEEATNGQQEDSAEDLSEVHSAKPNRNAKPKAEPKSSDNVGLGDIKKAATFANSVGGLDKAIALLQILKVAKEVQ